MKLALFTMVTSALAYSNLLQAASLMQTIDEAGVATDCNSATDMDIDSFCEVSNSSGSRADDLWIVYQLPAAKRVRSIFVLLKEDSGTENDAYFIEVGTTAKTKNPLACKAAAITQSGWYQCDNVLNGVYISVYNTGKAMLHFREIMVFEEYFIQPYLWYSGCTTYCLSWWGTGSLVKLYAQQDYDAMTTTDLSVFNEKYLYFRRKAAATIKSIVVIPNRATCPNIEVWVYSQPSWTYYKYYQITDWKGNLEFPVTDGLKHDEVKLQLTDYSTQLSITSIGILSDCDCLSTRFGQSDVWITNSIAIWEINPTQKSVYVKINGSSQTVLAYLADSVGVTCSADEQFCGPRTFQVLDASTGVAETALITFIQDTTTQIVTMTIAATTGMPVGTRRFNLMVTLTNYPVSQAVYSGFAVTVEAESCDSTTIDSLAAISDITVNMPVAAWPYITLTTPGNSASYLDTTLCGPYQLYVNNVATAFTSNDVYIVVTQAVGTYPQVIEFGLINYPSIPRSRATFNIIVTDLCASTVLNSFEARPSTVTVDQLTTSQSVTVSIPTNTVTEADPSIMCGPLVLRVNGTVQLLDASNMFTVTYALETTTYTTLLSFSLQDYPDISPVEYSLTQDVTYTDLCLTTTFTSPIAVNPPGPLSIPLPSTSQTYQFTYGSDTVSQILSSPDSCGLRFFKINGVDTSYDASYTFSILPSATQGTQTYEITMGLVDYPQVPVMSQSVVITVFDLCDTTVIDALAVQPDVTIAFPLPGQQIITMVAPGNSVSIAKGDPLFCGPLTFYVNSVEQTLDASNQFTIVPERAEATYTYVLSYGLQNYPLVTQSRTSFQVIVTDPCQHSILSNFEQAATYEILIGESVSIDIFVEPTDLESLKNGNRDGYTFCSSRQLVLTDSQDNPIYYYTYASNKLTITPISEGDASVILYWQLLNYPLVKSEKVMIAITVTEIKASIPYFSNGKPSFQYTMLPNSNLDLSFTILKDNGGEFTITAQLNQAALFGQYTATVQNGVGSLSFTFQSTSLLSTTTITITVAEVYDAKLCPAPTTRDYTFILKVEAPQNTTTKSNTTSKYVPPVILTKNITNSSKNASWAPESKSKLVLGIEYISRLAVVKVAYNQLLDPDFATMIFGFTQTSSLQPIHMNWTFISNASYEFYIQCTFDRPLSVSAGQQPDKLYVYFYDSKTDRQYKLQAMMPLLIASQEQLQMLSGISDTMGGTTKYIFYIYLACNVLFSFALGMLWGTFQTLQFIIDFPFLILKVPLNVLLVFQGFEDIVNMKIVNTTQVYEWTMSKVARQPQQRLLQDANTTSNTTEPTTAPDNLTSELFMAGVALIIVLLIIAMIVTCIKCYYQKLPKIIKSLVTTIKHKLMWNSILRYMTQSYLGHTITCMTNLLVYQTLTLTSKILTPIIFVYALSTPLIFHQILKRKKDLHSKDAKQSIGTLYMNQDTYKKSVVHYAVVFIVRRLIFAMTIAFIPNVVAQLYVTIMCSLMTLCYLCVWQPMENRVQNGLALFNESVLMTCGYLMFLFTDYVPTPELKYYFGNYLLYVLYLDFGLNFILLAREIILIIRRNCTRIIMHRRWRRQIRERMQKRKERKEWYNEIKKFKQNSFLQQTQNASMFQIIPGVQNKLIDNQPSNVKQSSSSLAHRSENEEQKEQLNVLSFISLDESLKSEHLKQKQKVATPLLSFISQDQSLPSAIEQDQRRHVQQSQRLLSNRSIITSELHSSMPSLRSNNSASQRSSSNQPSSEQQSSEQQSSSQSQTVQTSSYGSSYYTPSHLTSQQPSSRQHIASKQPSEITSIELSQSQKPQDSSYEAALSELAKLQSKSSVVYRINSYQPSDLSSISLSSQSHHDSCETPLKILSSNPSSSQASRTSSELGSNYRKYTPHPIRLNRRKIIE